MRSYRELKVWQKSYQLILFVYQTTRSFPREEIYGLISQLRRAAVSVAANIAEGFNRQTKKEYLQFLFISRGSLQELDFLASLVKDLGYIKKGEFENLRKRIELTGKLLSGLIRSIKRK